MGVISLKTVSELTGIAEGTLKNKIYAKEGIAVIFTKVDGKYVSTTEKLEKYVSSKPSIDMNNAE